MERLRELLAPEGHAIDLAVLRIAVAIVLATSASVAVADDWAALPAPARTAPLGVGWLVPHLPITPALVTGVRAVLQGACVCAAIGLASRASFAVAAACAAYVMLVPQLGGAVFHDHHLLWLAVLLAASPCGDALSIDAWWARRRGRAPVTVSRAHGAAIRAAWILIGVVFFFPGVHKLAEAGLAWIWSDNLRNQMWWKWAQDPATQPSFRIDRHPLLLRLGAAATVLFELTFLPLVLWRRTRALAVSAALAFHAATDLFMGIGFGALYATYVMFVPWSELARRVRPIDDVRGERALAPVAIVAAILVIGASLAGAAGAMQAYPFACYPTFQHLAADHMPAMAIEVERDDGTRETLDPALYRAPGPRGWALEWRLAGVYGPIAPSAIEAWWRDRAARDPLRAQLTGARAIHVHRVLVSVDPERRGEELERREIHVIARRRGARSRAASSRALPRARDRTGARGRDRAPAPRGA